MDPFTIKEHGGDIRDSSVAHGGFEVDGDVVAADQYRKHPKKHWERFQNSSILFYLCIVIFLILGSKLYYLQIVQGAKYYGVAEGNRIRQIPIIPPRGVIYDSEGARLAYNIPDFGLYVVPADLPKNQDDEDRIFQTIGKVLNKDPYDLVETFTHVPRNSTVPFEIMRGISQQDAILLEQEGEEWPAIQVKPIEQRTYSIVEPLSHILGYTGKMSESEYEKYRQEGYLLSEHVGKTGIEKTYQRYLRGALGTQFIEVNASGREIQITHEIPPQNGGNAYVHINAALQQYAWDLLKDTADTLGVAGGSIVILNPQNGAVLAMVSYPGYQNDLFSKGIDVNTYDELINDPSKPLFNRSITGEYPSGSTFKLVVGTAALEEGVVDRNTTVESVGGIDVNGYWFPDWKYGGHGRTNIIKALAESVNSYFYLAGGGRDGENGLGVDRITEYGKKFGLSEYSGIDLPAERPGFLPSKEWKEETKGERWYLGDTYHLAIGQGDILVTPLQVANYTAVVANRGTLYRPTIVNYIELADGSKKVIEPEIIRSHIAQEQNLDIIREGLRAAVTAGSARSLSTLKVPLAGKTGTAQYSQNSDPHAWFTGFGPYQNPEIVITVLVEEGEGGSLAATPIAKKLFEYYFNENQPSAE